MTLDLEPEVESTLRTYAAAVGLSPEIFFTRLLAKYQSQPVVNEADWKIRLRAAQERSQAAFTASAKTEQELGDEIDTKLRQLRPDALKVYRTEHSEP